MAAERDGIKDTDIEGALRGPVVGFIRLAFLGVGAEAAGGDGEGGYQNISGAHGDPPAALVAQYTRPSSDRKSVVLGKSRSVRVDLGSRRIIKKKHNQTL